MDFFIVLLLAIVAFVLGYKFIKNYNRIDRHFFGSTKRYFPTTDPNYSRLTVGEIVENDPDYEPFGRVQVLASTVLGILFTGIPILKGVGLLDVDNMEGVMLALTLVQLVILSYNLFEAIARMPTFGTRMGKLLFLTVACIIGTAIGALGSMLVFAALVIYLILLAIQAAISGTRLKPGEVELEDGTILKKRTGLFGETDYVDRDDSSRTFDRSGDIFTER